MIRVVIEDNGVKIFDECVIGFVNMYCEPLVLAVKRLDCSIYRVCNLSDSIQFTVTPV